MIARRGMEVTTVLWNSRLMISTMGSNITTISAIATIITTKSLLLVAAPDTVNKEGGTLTSS